MADSGADERDVGAPVPGWSWDDDGCWALVDDVADPQYLTICAPHDGDVSTAWLTAALDDVVSLYEMR